MTAGYSLCAPKNSGLTVQDASRSAFPDLVAELKLGINCMNAHMGRRTERMATYLHPQSLIRHPTVVLLVPLNTMDLQKETLVNMVYAKPDRSSHTS
jgi:hypothetical protein